MADFGNLTHAITLSDYRKAEQAGNINRPVTDGTIKSRVRTPYATPDTPSKGRDNPGWGMT